jgi:hypothetical protein
MRTVSQQGLALSANQRRAQQFQQQTRASFLNPILKQQVDESLERSAEYWDKENRKFRFDPYETDRLMQQLRKVSAFCAADCVFGYPEADAGQHTEEE